MTPQHSHSVGDALQSILPEGSNTELLNSLLIDDKHKDDAKYSWLLPPNIATDLFAACAHLCKIGGVIGFFNPSPYAKDDVPDQIKLSRHDRDEIDDVAWKWRGGIRGGHYKHKDRKEKCDGSPIPPEGVQALWNCLLENWDSPVHCGYYVNNAEDICPPEWWNAALRLMMIADLVVERPYLAPIKRFEGSPLGNLLKALYHAANRKLDKASRQDEQDTDSLEAPRGPPSLTFMADRDVACVMPKHRVAPVGATIRNVTRNLALLPGRSELRCFWDMTDAEPESEDGATLDILLIPAPFKLNAIDFRPEEKENGNTSAQDLHNDKPNWENFHLDQNWIKEPSGRDAFIDACINLVEQSKSETRLLNAVVLPEYALTYTLFNRLCKELKSRAPGLEFVISGASDNCEDTSANTLLTRVWRKREANKHITNSRRKHHRWRLDQSQVEAYGLGSVLNPKVRFWWEKTPIGQRELYFHRIRQDSTFAALICEELARSDACHDILRAIGPNLVFALLMDSAQIRGRWSAQYASSLADDPGCSVLTLTSFGLVERSNQTRRLGSQSIALWKDDTGRMVEIDMPEGTGPRGVLLSLWSEHVQDQTITGKRSMVRAWRYSGHTPIKPAPRPAPGR